MVTRGKGPVVDRVVGRAFREAVRQAYSSRKLTVQLAVQEARRGAMLFDQLCGSLRHPRLGKIFAR